ncbi:MAG: hypothetical protein WCH37_02885 [Synechococcaceae cyanobacterium ELA182]
MLAILYVLLRALASQASGNNHLRTPPSKPPKTSGSTTGIRPPLKPPLPPPLPQSPAWGRQDSAVPPHPYLPDYKITYTDRNGMVTDRRITIARIEGDMLYAYCHLRHARRTFYISRVVQWTNCSSGEITSDIMADFDAARKDSAFGLLDRMHGDLYPVMGALLYLGKGDRRLMIEERNTMIDAYKALCPDPRLTDQMINDSINEMAVPSTAKYKQLVAELSTMNPEIQDLATVTARRFFASRKKLNAVEQEGMDELHRQLNT